MDLRPFEAARTIFRFFRFSASSENVDYLDNRWSYGLDHKRHFGDDFKNNGGLIKVTFLIRGHLRPLGRLEVFKL